MNTTLISNVTILTLAVGALNAGIELIKTQDYVTGGVLVGVGIVLIILYEKLPISTPPQ